MSDLPSYWLYTGLSIIAVEKAFPLGCYYIEIGYGAAHRVALKNLLITSNTAIYHILQCFSIDTARILRYKANFPYYRILGLRDGRLGMPLSSYDMPPMLSFVVAKSILSLGASMTIGFPISLPPNPLICCTRITLSVFSIGNTR